MPNIVLLIFWLIIGMVNLCSSAPISKFSYFLVWTMVIVYFASRVAA